MRNFQTTRLVKILIIVGIAICAFTALLLYVSNLVGWYGYKKWEYRSGTMDIAESKKRGVFVVELKSEKAAFGHLLDSLHIYIEKGFRFGLRTSEETVLLTGTKFPYQLSFPNKLPNGANILMCNQDLRKFDSANATHGFLKEPRVPDTIYFEIFRADGIRSLVKVWQ